ncbi:Lecithin:cholesterol/ phospholipid:diacylglycerol acyltransferase like protein [Aduncisulcus paluster]|uniref:Lecithin:cholesterol/ phospholipid:diacylglycerol acyltransferase like protein n=1 Tax=Aduncisulcus paluster TaxID=2918883 RepID=A0ABQ5JVJ5_9EUKA|nr:Lecithin:cholesterol/ phospholipid:diacylglycerol acyltransferase like protein [Aduncisulcus paluster]
MNSKLKPIILIPGFLESSLSDNNAFGDICTVFPKNYETLDSIRSSLLDKSALFSASPKGFYGEYGFDSLKFPKEFSKSKWSQIFTNLIKKLKSVGYVPGGNLFVLSYDWRLNNLDQSNFSLLNLISFINTLYSKPLVLISHGTGGIFVKQFLNIHPELYNISPQVQGSISPQNEKSLIISDWIAASCPFYGGSMTAVAAILFPALYEQNMEGLPAPITSMAPTLTTQLCLNSFAFCSLIPYSLMKQLSLSRSYSSSLQPKALVVGKEVADSPNDLLSSFSIPLNILITSNDMSCVHSPILTEKQETREKVLTIPHSSFPVERCEEHSVRFSTHPDSIQFHKHIDSIPLSILLDRCSSRFQAGSSSSSQNDDFNLLLLRMYSLLSCSFPSCKLSSFPVEDHLEEGEEGDVIRDKILEDGIQKSASMVSGLKIHLIGGTMLQTPWHSTICVDKSTKTTQQSKSSLIEQIVSFCTGIDKSIVQHSDALRLTTMAKMGKESSSPLKPDEEEEEKRKCEEEKIDGCEEPTVTKPQTLDPSGIFASIELEPTQISMTHILGDEIIPDFSSLAYLHDVSTRLALPKTSFFDTLSSSESLEHICSIVTIDSDSDASYSSSLPSHGSHLTHLSDGSDHTSDHTSDVDSVVKDVEQDIQGAVHMHEEHEHGGETTTVDKSHIIQLSQEKRSDPIFRTPVIVKERHPHRTPAMIDDIECKKEWELLEQIVDAMYAIEASLDEVEKTIPGRDIEIAQALSGSSSGSSLTTKGESGLESIIDGKGKATVLTDGDHLSAQSDEQHTKTPIDGESFASTSPSISIPHIDLDSAPLSPISQSPETSSSSDSLPMVHFELASPSAFSPNLIAKGRKKNKNRVSPILFVPGAGGSILRCKDNLTGKDFVVWPRALGTSAYVERYMWGKYNPSTEKYEHYMYPARYNIYARRSDDGLYGVDNLLTDTIPIIGDIIGDQFHSMINFFKKKRGLVQGVTLFGFPYDWRQDMSAGWMLDDLQEAIERAYIQSGARKVDIICHSLGGLLILFYYKLRHDHCMHFVRSISSLGTPYRGTGCTTSGGVLEGYCFGKNNINCRSFGVLETTTPVMLQLYPNMIHYVEPHKAAAIYVRVRDPKAWSVKDWIIEWKRRVVSSVSSTSSISSISESSESSESCERHEKDSVDRSTKDDSHSSPFENVDFLVHPKSGSILVSPSRSVKISPNCPTFDSTKENIQSQVDQSEDYKEWLCAGDCGMEEYARRFQQIQQFHHVGKQHSQDIVEKCAPITREEIQNTEGYLTIMEMISLSNVDKHPFWKKLFLGAVDKFNKEEDSLVDKSKKKGTEKEIVSGCSLEQEEAEILACDWYHTHFQSRDHLNSLYALNEEIHTQIRVLLETDGNEYLYEKGANIWKLAQDELEKRRKYQSEAELKERFLKVIRRGKWSAIPKSLSEMKEKSIASGSELFFDKPLDKMLRSNESSSSSDVLKSHIKTPIIISEPISSTITSTVKISKSEFSIVQYRKEDVKETLKGSDGHVYPCCLPSSSRPVPSSISAFRSTNLLNQADLSEAYGEIIDHPFLSGFHHAYRKRYYHREAIPIPSIPPSFSYNVFIGHSIETPWDAVCGESIVEMGGICQCIGCKWVRRSEGIVDTSSEETEDESLPFSLSAHPLLYHIAHHLNDKPLSYSQTMGDGTIPTLHAIPQFKPTELIPIPCCDHFGMLLNKHIWNKLNDIYSDLDLKERRNVVGRK